MEIASQSSYRRLLRLRVSCPGWFLVGLALALPAMATSATASKPLHRQPTPGVLPRSVAAENGRAGTPGWLGPLATNRAAEVYASATDASPGSELAVHVSTVPVASYRVLVYRLGWYGGVGAREVACLPSCSGSERGSAEAIPGPELTGRIVAGWPVTDTVRVGRDWVSGYYLIRVLLVDGPQAGSSATTYFVVTSPRRTSRMLIQVPVLTWQAYNSWGG